MSLSEEQQLLPEEESINITRRRDIRMKLILVMSVVMGLATKLLKFERNEKGNLVPVDIFRGHSNMFYAFVVFVMFAFTGSSGALAFPQEPKLDKFRRLYSVCAILFMVLALGILSFACLLDFLHPSIQVSMSDGN